MVETEDNSFVIFKYCKSCMRMAIDVYVGSNNWYTWCSLTITMFDWVNLVLYGPLLLYLI